MLGEYRRFLGKAAHPGTELSVVALTDLIIFAAHLVVHWKGSVAGELEAGNGRTEHLHLLLVKLLFGAV